MPHPAARSRRCQCLLPGEASTKVAATRAAGARTNDSRHGRRLRPGRDAPPAGGATPSRGGAGRGARHAYPRLWKSRLATATGADAPDTGAAHALGAYLLRGSVALTATFFAVGSTLFSWLLLRGRMIPIPLAWLGVVASVLLVVGLPLQLAGFLRGQVTSLLWLPMLAFEVPLALWLLIKGVAMPTRTQSA